MDYKKLSLYNTAGMVVYLLAQWLLTVIVTRLLGFAAAGVFSLAISVSNVFHYIQLYGGRSFQVTDVKSEFSATTYITTRRITTVAGAVLCAVYLIFSGNSWEKIIAISLYMVFKSFEAYSDVFFGEMQKLGRLDYAAISMLVKSVTMVLLFVAILKLQGSLNLALLAIALAAMALTFFYDIPKYRALSAASVGRFSWPKTVSLLKAGFWITLTTFFPIVVTSLPRVILDMYCGAEELGFYSNIATPTVLITAVVPNILIPFMTLYSKYLVEGEYHRLLKSFFMSILMCLGLGAALMLGMKLMGNAFYSLLYGERILPYVHYVFPLIIATVVYAMSMCGNSILITMRLNMHLTLFAGAALVSCLALSPVLIPRMGITGAILSMGLSYGLQLALQVIHILRSLAWRGKNEREVHS